MNISEEWQDYFIIDAGDKEKLESWNGIILRRPDPEAIWPKGDNYLWDNPDAYYHRSSEGGGYWEYKKKSKADWTVTYRDLTFKVSPTNFKHLGLFPEQAYNWDYIIDKIKKSKREIKVLNLFAYTGAATMAASIAGGEVTQVDASKGMTLWAKENMRLSGLENNKIKFIVDDVLKFVLREQRRGNTYDAIIMDPPSYGRGPNKEIWKFEDNIYDLVTECVKLLSNKPLFFLINSYTTGISSTVIGNILTKTVYEKYQTGMITTGELGLRVKDSNLILPCGIFGRWEDK